MTISNGERQRIHSKIPFITSKICSGVKASRSSGDIGRRAAPRKSSTVFKSMGRVSIVVDPSFRCCVQLIKCIEYWRPPSPIARSLRNFYLGAEVPHPLNDVFPEYLSAVVSAKHKAPLSLRVVSVNNLEQLQGCRMAVSPLRRTELKRRLIASWDNNR